jgi:PAP_fibrillin
VVLWDGLLTNSPTHLLLQWLQPYPSPPTLQLNVVHFNVAGLGMFSGSLTVRAAYEVVSDSRVSIRFLESTMVPEQLQSLFQANYALLLSIFNPEGWLDITYVDDDMRVGRDDKGNLFVLQRGASTGANKA